MIPGDFFVNNCRISQIVISAAAPPLSKANGTSILYRKNFHKYLVYLNGRLNTICLLLYSF